MSIPYLDLDRTEELFSHWEDGKQTTFAVTRLREHCREHERCFLFSVEASQAEHFIEHCGIEQARLDRLTQATLEDPVLIVRWYDDTYLLVDGHHRYVKRHQLGLTECAGYVVEDIPTLEAFLVADMPALDCETTVAGPSGL
jgi:hypothetical protein